MCAYVCNDFFFAGKRKSDSIASNSSPSYYSGDHTLPLEPSNHTNHGNNSSSGSSFGDGPTASKRINSGNSYAQNPKTTTYPQPQPHRTSSGGSFPKTTKDTSVSSELVAHGGKDWKTSGIHPSWAAKQLAKKAAVVISATAPAAGKKITFDDD